MNRTIPLALAAGLAATAASATSHIGVADFEATDPVDVALVLALDSGVYAANEVIGACRRAGGELDDCVCDNQLTLNRVRAALDAVLAARPDWVDKALFVYDNTNGQSLTIWLDTVARMVEPPDCG